MFISPYSPRILDGIERLSNADPSIEVINCSTGNVMDYIIMHDTPPIIISPLPEELFIL